MHNKRSLVLKYNINFFSPKQSKKSSLEKNFKLKTFGQKKSRVHKPQTSIPGKGVTSEPVATKIYLALITS